MRASTEGFRHVVVAVAFAVCGAVCGSGTAPDGERAEPDAGSTSDAGPPSVDGGAPGADGGSNEADAGMDAGGGDPCVAALGLACADFEEAYVKASNTDAGDSFGFRVALDANTLAISAWQEDSAATGVDGDEADDSAAGAGAVYVFTRSGATWSQQAYLKGSNTSAGDGFGFRLTLDGDTLAVSAWLEDSAATGVNGDQTDDSSEDSGAVYVFARLGTTWSQQAYLKASNTGVEDHFGGSLALSGDTLAVGAFDEDSSATGVGGDELDDGAEDSGAVYVFTRVGSTWAQEAYLKASNTDAGDRFGIRVAVDADTLVVGAPSEASSASGVDGDQDDDGARGSGAAYAFTRDRSSWAQQAYLKASNSSPLDNFGGGLALDGDTLAVGAPNQDSSGAVYAFARTDDTWRQRAFLKARAPEPGDRFGGSVALDGDLLAVGAYEEDSSATSVGGDETDSGARNSGAVYLFRRAGESWSSPTFIKASNTDVEDAFGVSLALSGRTLAVGADWEDSSATGVDGDESDNRAERSGAVYVRRVSP